VTKLAEIRKKHQLSTWELGLAGQWTRPWNVLRVFHVPYL